MGNGIDLGEANGLRWLGNQFREQPTLLEPDVLQDLVGSYARKPNMMRALVATLPTEEAREALILEAALPRWGFQAGAALDLMEMVPIGSQRESLLTRFQERPAVKRERQQRELFDQARFDLFETRFREWGLPEERIEDLRTTAGVMTPDR